MRLLLDTHALLWWLDGDPGMAKRARDAVDSRDSVVFVSAASAWEIATKHRLGKLPVAAKIVGQISLVLARQDFKELPISLHHAEVSGMLPGDHRDPFDRLLIAQAKVEGLTLVSNERLFDAFGVNRLW